MSWRDDDTPCPAAGVAIFVPDDGSDVVLWDDTVRRLYRLTPTAATIWAAVDGVRPVSAVIEIVSGVHDVAPAVAADDILDHLDRLQSLGLITASTGLRADGGPAPNLPA